MEENIENIGSLDNDFWENVGKQIKKFIKYVAKSSHIYKNTFQRIHITFIYFFAIIVLAYSVKNSIGYIPEMILQFIPFLSTILDNKFLIILARPETTFFTYLVVLELFVTKSLFNFSILIKFNLLFIFLLEMLQNLIANYWDLLFTREIHISVMNTSPTFSKSGYISFYVINFFVFLFLYLHAYYRGMRGKFPQFPQPVVDSVAFWLHIKTPNMRFGEDK
jgi:hypothetical protein